MLVTGAVQRPGDVGYPALHAAGLDELLDLKGALVQDLEEVVAHVVEQLCRHLLVHVKEPVVAFCLPLNLQVTKRVLVQKIIPDKILKII